MKIQLIIFALGVLIANLLFAQTEKVLVLKTTNGELEGTLLVPEGVSAGKLALLISGSGPTDRNGNNPVMQNNSLKMLAEALASKGIATLRYDKRGIGASKAAGLNESDLRFEMYVDDAIEWIKLLAKNPDYTKLYVIGHSEGSLIGMLTAQKTKLAGFVSIAGPGQAADKIIRDQLKMQPPVVIEQSAPILDSLLAGKTVQQVPPMLAALFRPSVQPYMISWFKYDPQIEIAKLKIPVLIVQGTTDIQVNADEAKRLQAANKNAKMVLVEGMNHILKNADADRMKNMQTYSQPGLALNEQLVQVVSGFISGE